MLEIKGGGMSVKRLCTKTVGGFKNDLNHATPKINRRFWGLQKNTGKLSFGAAGSYDGLISHSKKRSSIHYTLADGHDLIFDKYFCHFL